MDERTQLRIVNVKGRIGFFHCWEQLRRGAVMPNDPYENVCPAGEMMKVLAIVEFENSVERVDPTDVNFVDTMNHELWILNKGQKQKEEKEPRGLAWVECPR